MKLSAKTRYGLRICHALALSNAPMSATTLQKNLGISAKYIEKIMRMLAARQIIGANRGALGGYFLCRPPAEITVGEIVRALEDGFEIVPCISSPCSSCASSSVWRKMYDGINDVLDNITLKNMSDEHSNDTSSCSFCQNET